MIILKGVALMLPSIAYLWLSILIWKGRLLGSVGRRRFGMVGFVVAMVVGGVILGGAIGSVIYDAGPGRGCRELACLAGVVWALGGAVIGLGAGLTLGIRLRRHGGKRGVAFLLPSIAAVLGSLSAVLFNSDMLR
jgi:hypothetical protein